MEVSSGTKILLAILAATGVVAVQAAPPALNAPIVGPITSSTTASVSSEVTSDGGAALSARGFVYSVTSVNPNPLLLGPGVVDLPALPAAVGVFNGNLTGLAPDTEYTVKAYATNIDGTTYTAPITLTTLNDDADLTNLNLSSGTLSPLFVPGTLPYTAQVSNLTSSITVTPTASDATGAVISVQVNTGGFDLATSGSPFAAPLPNVGLNTIDVRVLAEDTAIEQTYTVAVTRQDPLLLTGTPTSTLVTSSGATLGGNVTQDGGDGIIRRGVVYAVKSVDADPNVGDGSVTVADIDGPHVAGAGIGAFSQGITGLTEGTTYAFKAFAENAGGIVYSNVAEFTTLPELNALSITDFAPSATAGNQGELSPAFGPAIFAYTATVSNLTETLTVTPNRAQTSSTKIEARVNAGSFVEVTPATASSTLALNVGSNSVDVRVTAQDGTTQATYTISVTRRNPLAIAPATTLTGIAETAATVGGNITEDGGDSITVRGVVSSESLLNNTPELLGANVDDAPDSSMVPGVFTVALTLDEGMNYSARSYVSNAGGTVYSDVVQFTTDTGVDIPLNLVGQVATRVILPSGSQKFHFTVASPTVLDILTQGAPNAQVQVFNSSNVPVGSFAPLALSGVQLPAAGSYYVVVTHTDPMGANETFDLFIDASTPLEGTPRPDVAVGKNTASLVGFGDFSKSQKATLISKRAGTVKGFAAIGNLVDFPADVAVRAGRSNSYFKVKYIANGADVTTALQAGTFRTGTITSASGLKTIEVTVKPVRKKLKKGGKIKKKTFTSTFVASASGASDSAKLQVSVE